LLNSKRLKDYILKEGIRIKEFILSLEINLEKSLVEFDFSKKTGKYFDQLCKEYCEIINKTICFPQVLCEIINDYANNLIYLVRKFEYKDEDLPILLIKKILKHNCKDYETIKGYILYNYPELLVKYLEKSNIEKYQDEEFLIKNFGIETPYNCKNNSFKSSQSLLKVIRESNNFKINGNLNAYSLETLTKCIMQYSISTEISESETFDIRYNNFYTIEINYKVFKYKYSTLTIV